MSRLFIDLDPIVRHLDRALPQYLQDLEELVNIDSGTFDKEGVDRVGTRLRERYSKLGADLKMYPHDLYGDSFAASFVGDGGGSILLLGHLDTVYPAGTTSQRPFRIEQARAYGPGVADMKSGDLSILHAIEALLGQDFRHFGTITVLHNSDEEIGSPSSRELIRAHAEGADAVLVVEAGRENGNLVSRRKGIASFRLQVHGKAAHAGVNRERGRSAALELAHLVIALEALNGQIPGATLNVGRLEAGQRANVVPDHAVAHLEIRAFELERLQEMIDLVQETVRRRTVAETDVELDTSIDHVPMPSTPASRRLLQAAQELASQLGFQVDAVATGGASDGNTAAAAGRPVLDGLGPVGGQAHSPHEYLDISSILPRTALLAGLICRVGVNDW